VNGSGEANGGGGNLENWETPLIEEAGGRVVEATIILVKTKLILT